MNRMLFQLYIFPSLLLVGSFAISYVLGVYIPEQLSGSIVFSSLVEISLKLKPWAGLVLLGVSVCWGANSTYRLWRWYKGKCEICYSCGGISDYKVGRYGPYYKCLACGKNRSIK